MLQIADKYLYISKISGKKGNSSGAFWQKIYLRDSNNNKKFQLWEACKVLYNDTRCLYT